MNYYKILVSSILFLTSTICYSSNTHINIIEDDILFDEKGILADRNERAREEKQFFFDRLKYDPFLIRLPSQILVKQLSLGQNFLHHNLIGSTIYVEQLMFNAYSLQKVRHLPKKVNFDKLPIGLKIAVRTASQGGEWVLYIPSHLMQLKSDIGPIRHDEPVKLTLKIVSINSIKTAING